MPDVTENTAFQGRFFLINHLSSSYIAILLRVLEPGLQGVCVCVCVCVCVYPNPLILCKYSDFQMEEI